MDESGRYKMNVMYKYTLQDGWQKVKHVFAAFKGEAWDEELLVKSGFEKEPAFCVGTEGRFYIEIQVWIV